MNIQQIMSRYDSTEVLFECELPEGIESGMAMLHALEKAVAADAYLAGANLAGANLAGANLADANLARANLARANLAGAYLARANLVGAYLADANLARANLAGAYLADANLARANLARANLAGAYLADANLAGAYLSAFKADFFDVLLRSTNEVAGLRAAIVEGRIDGSTYEGRCACLVGTIAHVRGDKFDALGNGLTPDSSRPAEQWFMSICKGDTPETNQASRLAVEWVDEFLSLLNIAKGDALDDDGKPAEAA